jgi:hypothetical protein
MSLSANKPGTVYRRGVAYVSLYGRDLDVAAGEIGLVRRIVEVCE